MFKRQITMDWKPSKTLAHVKPVLLKQDIDNSLINTYFISMENKSKKKTDDGDRREKDDDEVKMEKFYSLLRRFRDARDRRRKELEELEKSERKKRKMKMEQPSRSWVPSFEWGDFTNEVEFRKPPSVFPTPTSTSTSPSPTPTPTDKSQKDHYQGHSLDLNLAL